MSRETDRNRGGRGRERAPGNDHSDLVDEGPTPGAGVVEELTAQQQAAEGAAPGDEARMSSEGLVRALEDQKDRYLRLAAEFENFRRRTGKERLEVGARAQAELAQAMLEPLDDLARFAAVDISTVDAKALVTGLELVSKKLMKALAAAGLEQIDPQDQTFDPALHEAVSTAAALSPEDDDMIAAVFQPGYRFKGQLLRPARVVVKKWNA